MPTLHVFECDTDDVQLQEWAKEYRSNGYSVRIVERVIRAGGTSVKVSVAIVRAR